MRIYNTLTRQKEELKPLEPGHFKMYSCGPTVYRYIHIGNLRTFTTADWLRRALLHSGYKVTHIKNITDVGHMRVERLDAGEDKILSQARKEGKTSAEIAAFYTAAFREDERKLNILPAQVFPRATQHINEMIEIVRGLVDHGVAYEVDGNVFFEIAKWPQYGQLSGNQLAGLMEGIRDRTDKLRRQPEDFPLWKAAEPGREMAWDSPWGRGFPGWHIECSAMSMKYLGEHFDIHTGGVDNIFPHHEGELAQSEAYTGEKFVNYWVHAQHLLADGLKMAKSTGNAYTLSEVEALDYDPLALRYFFTTAHYRSRINFTFSALRSAQVALNRLRLHLVNLSQQVELGRFFNAESEVRSEWNKRFWEAINDDLNLPRAMAIVWQMLRQPASELSPVARLGMLLDWDQVLGFGLEDYLRSDQWRRLIEPEASQAALPVGLLNLVRQRALARRDGNYSRADQLRRELKLAGYELRDTTEGTLALPRRAEADFPAIGKSTAGPNHENEAALYDFSVNLLAQNSRDDLDRCLKSLLRHAHGYKLELIVLDNGSTDDTLAYLRDLARDGLVRLGTAPDAAVLQVIFADHNLGFAAGRNATTRASRGRYVVWLDTSIELQGDIWTPLAATLADPQVGVTGPYGLVTRDLRDFDEATGPDVDGIEGYLLAFRRELWPQVGPLDEKFRFYRMADIHFSFFFLAAGYRVVALPALTERLTKHPHREWYSLAPEERQTKSKKNYDLFRERWHHGQSLLVANNREGQRCWGHDVKVHLGDHFHDPTELPPPGVAHTHRHQHWADHDHNHPHVHNELPVSPVAAEPVELPNRR